jgi:serine/threonine protein kinase
MSPDGGGVICAVHTDRRGFPRGRVPGGMPVVPAKFLVPTAGGGGGKHRQQRGGRKDGGGAKEKDTKAKGQGGVVGTDRTNGSGSDGGAEKGDDDDDGDSASSGSDDEGSDGYRKGGYHPVKVGEVFRDGRYVVRKKLGWGHFSTVWLCDDLETRTQIALKVQKSASHYTEAALDEIEILKRVQDVESVDFGETKEQKDKRQRPHHRAVETKTKSKSKNAGRLAASRFGAKLRDASDKSVTSSPSVSTSSQATEEEKGATRGIEPGMEASSGTVNGSARTVDGSPEREKYSKQGARFVVTLLDSFTHKGPHGTHVCMTFPVLGNNLLDVIKRFDYRGAPVNFVKQMARDVLRGLEYLHVRKNIIHTDLKPENVLLTKILPSWEEVRAKESAGFASAAAGVVVRPAVAVGERGTGAGIGEQVSNHRVEAEAPVGDVKEIPVTEVETEADAKKHGAQETLESVLREVVELAESRSDLRFPAEAPAGCVSERKNVAGKDGDTLGGVANGRSGDAPTTIHSELTEILPSTSETPGGGSCASEENEVSETETETKKKPPTSRGGGPTPVPADLCGLGFRVVDLGNACWTYKQFTSDIQTRQYRCPEVRISHFHIPPTD